MYKQLFKKFWFLIIIILVLILIFLLFNLRNSLVYGECKKLEEAECWKNPICIPSLVEANRSLYKKCILRKDEYKGCTYINENHMCVIVDYGPEIKS